MEGPGDNDTENEDIIIQKISKYIIINKPPMNNYRFCNFFSLHHEGEVDSWSNILTHSIVEKEQKNRKSKTFFRNRNLDIYFCPNLKSQNTFGFLKILLTII